MTTPVFVFRFFGPFNVCRRRIGVTAIGTNQPVDYRLQLTGVTIMMPWATHIGRHHVPLSGRPKPSAPKSSKRSGKAATRGAARLKAMTRGI
jgi:hypothetical protein